MAEAACLLAAMGLAASAAPAQYGGGENTPNQPATRADAGSGVVVEVPMSEFGHRESAAPAQEPDYEAMEREHFGDADKRTGIYAAPVTSAAPVVPEDWSRKPISDEPCPNCKGAPPGTFLGAPIICALCKGCGKLTAFGKSHLERLNRSGKQKEEGNANN
jgi:hypothetical protein